MKKGNPALKVLSELDMLVACIPLLILIVTTFVGVPMRYVLGQPFTWLEEVQSACLVWIVFASAGAAFRTGSHVAIEMIVERFPKNVQKILQICITAVVIVVVGYLFIQSIGYIQMFMRSGRSTPMQIVSYVTTTIRDWNKIGEEQKMEGLD